MRRIPRPQRSIDQITTSSHLLRHSSSPFACRSALKSPHLLRAVSATSSLSFSTSSSYGFLNAEKDPKKYKASIRKWQKRLTGDSEPIGAHVDPFDPTSPIRIRPEEQGDEVERLVEDKVQEAKVDDEDVSIESYVKQDSGDGLMWIGGKEVAGDAEQSVSKPTPPPSHLLTSWQARRGGPGNGRSIRTLSCCIICQRR